MPSTPDGIKLVIEGKQYDLDFTDFDRFEWRDLKQVLGMSQVQIFSALGELDLDAIAGFVWLLRRRDEPDLKFDDVNLRLSDLFEPEEAKGSDDPPG